LGAAALAINDLTLAPLGMCCNAVLAASALAVQTHVDILLPTGMARPCSLFLLTVGESGERKSDVDLRASWPIAKREAELREVEDSDKLTYENERALYEVERKTTLADKKLSPTAKRDKIKKLTPPLPPLDPLLTCDEPTVEGLVKLLATGQPSVGVFSAEGGQFIGGYGMNAENKLKTASNLSKLWDGLTVKRVRSGDGTIVLPGRRVSLHLMTQSGAAALMLGDPVLANVGLLSRMLLSAPDSTCGTRFWEKQRQRLTTADDLKVYTDRVYEILAQELPLAKGKKNQLEPRPLSFSPAAARLWVKFSDEVEARIGPGGALEPIRGLANKLPEHAGRISAILQVIVDLNAAEVSVNCLASGIELANHYAAEAQRLFLVGARNPDLVLADRLLAWLRNSWFAKETSVSLPDIYQRGLNAVGDAATARKLVTLLEDHEWFERDDNGGEIKGVYRQTVWRPVQT
jgi:hypothetical protein